MIVTILWDLEYASTERSERIVSNIEMSSFLKQFMFSNANHESGLMSGDKILIRFLSKYRKLMNHIGGMDS